jgi:hypothetical protein
VACIPQALERDGEKPRELDVTEVFWSQADRDTRVHEQVAAVAAAVLEQVVSLTSSACLAVAAAIRGMRSSKIQLT